MFAVANQGKSKAATTVVAATLSDDHYRILQAPNGDEAMRLADDHAPQVFVLDLHMPGLDGIEVCRRVRQHPRCKGALVVMLTGDGDPSERDRALAAGANTFLTKPFSVGELLARIRAILRRTDRATGKQGTEYVKQAATFLGPGKGFLEPWTIPLTKTQIVTRENVGGGSLWAERIKA